MLKNYFAIFCSFTLFTIGSLKAQNVALDFDGIDDYVQTNYTGVSGNGARTIEAWIRTTKNSLPTGSGGAGQSVIADWGSFTTGGRFTFNILWSNAIRIEVGGNGLSGTTAVNDGNWHHVAVTYNPNSTPNINMYVDGVRDVAGNVTVPINTGSVSDMRIGARIDGLSFFEGGIDEVRVYNFEKDSTSIYATMNQELCGTLPTGLVSYFKLNEGIPNGGNIANSLATDYISNNTNALLGFALNGTASNWVNGPTLIGGNATGSISDVACANYTSPSGNNIWTTTGIYTDTLVSSSGCDSLLTVDLTILQSEDSVFITDCDSYTAPSGLIYTVSGSYQDTFFSGNSVGCDSITYIELFIGSVSISFMDTIVCDEITINGTSYTSSTLFVDTFPSGLAGCDSIVTYNITVFNSASTSETIDACDSVEYDGAWYFSTQQLLFSGNTNNLAACDSVHVVNLVVNSSSAPTFDTILACDSILIEGVWYSENTNLEILYFNAQGCDSTHFIDLTVESFDFNNIEFNNWQISLLDTLEATFDWYNCEDSSFIESNTTGVLFNTVFPEYYAVVTTANCVYSSPCYPWQPESINDLFNSQFSLTPNPNTGSFNIDLGSENKASNYSIVNIVGQQVAFKTLDNFSHFVVDENLIEGMYLIMIETNNGKFAKKFLVK